MTTICGTDCSNCHLKVSCKGCISTCGKPFGGNCIIANCCKSKGLNFCTECTSQCKLKSDLIERINLINIKDLPKISELFALKGSVINMEYFLQNGEKIKFWENDDIYLGTQMQKSSNSCYGIATDGHFVLICEYGTDGSNPQIICYQKI